jgi:hypothetical protein
MGTCQISLREGDISAKDREVGVPQNLCQLDQVATTLGNPGAGGGGALASRQIMISRTLSRLASAFLLTLQQEWGKRCPASPGRKHTLDSPSSTPCCSI